MLVSTEIPLLVKRINSAAFDRGHYFPIVRQVRDTALVIDLRALAEICEAAPPPERPLPGGDQLSLFTSGD